MGKDVKITVKQEGREQKVELKRENIILRSGGGHIFVTELPLPKDAEKGTEYVLMGDLTDPSTYKGTYIFNPDTDSFVASSSGSGGSIVVDNDLSEISTNPVQNKVITKALGDKADAKDIPDVSNFATKDDLAGKQDELKSGENIKTINGESILGEGNIVIEGGGGGGSLTSDMTVSNPIGKWEKDQVIAEGTSIETVVRGMLSQTYYPTFVAPTASLSYSIPSLAKVGATINALAATVSFNPGAINLEGKKQANRAGAATGFSVNLSNASISYSDSNNTGSFNIPSFTRTSKGTVTLTGKVDYAAGPQPKDSDGANYGSPLPAGSVSSSKSVEFILPFYHGVSNTPTVSNFSGLTEDLTKKGQKQYTYTTSNQYMVIAFDASYGNLTSILDPNNFETINAWSKSALTVDGQNYTVYVAKSATSATARYTFKF